MLTKYKTPFNNIPIRNASESLEKDVEKLLRLFRREAENKKYKEKSPISIYEEIQRSYEKYKETNKEVEIDHLLQQELKQNKIEDLCSAFKIHNEEDYKKSLENFEEGGEVKLSNKKTPKKGEVFRFFVGFFIFIQKILEKEEIKGVNLKKIRNINWDKIKKYMVFKKTKDEDNIWRALYSEITGEERYKTKTLLSKISLKFLWEKKKVRRVTKKSLESLK